MKAVLEAAHFHNEVKFGDMILDRTPLVRQRN